MCPALDNSRCPGPKRGCCSAQRRFSRSAKSRSKTFCVRSKTASSLLIASCFSVVAAFPKLFDVLLLAGDYPMTPLDMGPSQSETFLDGGVRLSRGAPSVTRAPLERVRLRTAASAI